MAAGGRALSRVAARASAQAGQLAAGPLLLATVYLSPRSGLLVNFQIATSLLLLMCLAHCSLLLIFL